MNCKRCDGSGQAKNLQGKAENCYACEGKGEYPEIDVDAILQLILASKGKNKGGLKSNMVSPGFKDGVLKNRAYYIWRMARFHGGVDITMPIMASMCARHDPYKEQLDQLADQLALNLYGSHLSAAKRWGKALGYQY